MNDRPEPEKKEEEKDGKRERSFTIRIPIKKILFVLAVGLVVFFVFDPFKLQTPDTPAMSLSELQSNLDSHKVASAKVKGASDGHEAEITLTDGTTHTVTTPEGYAGNLTDRLLAAHVGKVEADTGGFWSGFWGFFPLIILGLWMLVSMVPGLRSQHQGLKMLNPGYKPADIPKTTLADVAGIPEVVEEVEQFVDYLKHPEKYEHLGIKRPKGALFTGQPGVGKTLTARAVAGEAGVPFFEVSGSEFVELFVGVGASRVRSLFEKAKGHSPDEKSVNRRTVVRVRRAVTSSEVQKNGAIIFIDELDAVGRKRAEGGITGGSQEHEHTLTQLLTEMDGFEGSRIMVFAATNQPDSLDPALKRPGRFDREIVFPAPDVRGREQILELHAKGRPIASDVNLRRLARQTPGFTGADLDNLINQAGFAMLKRDPKAKEISAADFQEALATVMIGPARKSVEVLERDRKITARHEAGHAIVGFAINQIHDPHHISIVPRGHAGGATWTTGSDEKLSPRTEIVAQIARAMGGRVAEKLFLNGDFTQGAADDLAKASELALSMVGQWGMGERLLVSSPGQQMPDAWGTTVVEEAEEILKAAEAQATRILENNKPAFEQLADELEREEVVEGERIEYYKTLVNHVDVNEHPLVTQLA